MTPQSPTESEWREWYRREYAVRGPEAGPSTVSRTAYLAAASRRDALTKLERDVVETAMAWAKEYDTMECGGTSSTRLALSEAVAALSRARTPKVVDRVAEAQRILEEFDPGPGGKLIEALDLLTAELRERDGGKP